MARTASTNRNEVNAMVSVFDLVYLVAENRGSMLTQKQLGEILYKNETQIVQAMKDAAMKYIEPIVFKMAGITPREISDNGATVETIEALPDMAIVTQALNEASDNSASLQNEPAKVLKAGKK